MVQGGTGYPPKVVRQRPIYPWPDPVSGCPELVVALVAWAFESLVCADGNKEARNTSKPGSKPALGFKSLLGGTMGSIRQDTFRVPRPQGAWSPKPTTKREFAL